MNAMDKFEEVWEKLPDADRHVLLGHTNDELTVEDKIKLAKIMHSLATHKK